ncbi:MAG: flagellar protein FlgN [Spirochaetaceae bacterium]|jgi:hypothetical protein|nr:flagellar protein FlgN [Spirochaetaceae bacterium]
MNNTENAVQILRIFDEEFAVLVEIEELQEVVEAAVYEKKWTNFENAQNCLNKLCVQLEELEARRITLFQNQAGENTGKNFYAWAASLPEPERTQIMNGYRKLKYKTSSIKSQNEAFGAYLNDMQIIVMGFLDAVFPERRAGIYGRQGSIRGADMRRAVLDKQF